MANVTVNLDLAVETVLPAKKDTMENQNVATVKPVTATHRVQTDHKSVKVGVVNVSVSRVLAVSNAMNVRVDSKVLYQHVNHVANVLNHGME